MKVKAQRSQTIRKITASPIFICLQDKKTSLTTQDQNLPSAFCFSASQFTTELFSELVNTFGYQAKWKWVDWIVVMPRGLAQVIIVLFFICAIFGMRSFQHGLFLHVSFLVYALFGMCYLWHELFFACVYLEYALFGICSLACALFSMCSLAYTLFCMCFFSACAH